VEITVINTASPRFSDNFTAADPPENVVVTIYQWFGGLQYSEKEILFRGVITGSIKYDEYTCTMTVRGIFEKYNKQIGADMIITPDADPDEYGKMSNIIYGDIEDVPCRAIVSGDVNSLVSAITAIQTSIELSDASYFPANGVMDATLNRSIIPVIPAQCLPAVPAATTALRQPRTTPARRFGKNYRPLFIRSPGTRLKQLATFLWIPSA
jgi:hypothetical protein